MKYFNILWFLASAVVSALIAYICQSLIPIATSSLSPDGISHGIYDLLSRSEIVQIACGVALFGIFFTLVGMGGQFLTDTVGMYRLQQYIKATSQGGQDRNAIKGRDLIKVANDTGDLARPCAEYIAASPSTDNQPFTATLQADRFFGFETQVSSRLNLWFFDSLTGILISIGVILLFLGLVSGVDDMLFRSVLSAQQPVSGLLSTLQTGVFALSICMISAVVARIFVRLFTSLRRTQTVRFNSQLDSLFLTSSSDIQALHQPLKTLSEAQVLIAEDRTEQMAKVMDGALKKLTDTLMGEFQSQIKSTSKLLEETEKQVTKSSVAVQAAHETLAKYARGQSTAIDKAINAALSTHLKGEEKVRTGMTSAVTKAMQAVQQGMDETAKSNKRLLEETLETIRLNKDGGLAEAAANLQRTQSEIARLVSAVEIIAGRSGPLPRGTSPVKEEYLRLVGADAPIGDPPPLEGLTLHDDDSEDNEDRVDRLTKALKVGGGAKPTKAGKKPRSDKRLTSALNDIKHGSEPSDLPEL